MGLLDFLPSSWGTVTRPQGINPRAAQPTPPPPVDPNPDRPTITGILSGLGTNAGKLLPDMPEVPSWMLTGDAATKKATPDAPFTARPGNLSPDQKSPYSPEGITSMIDLKKLGVDLASGKVKNAPGLADSIVGQPKPRPAGGGKKPVKMPEFNFSQGTNMDPNIGSVLPDVNEEIPQTLSTSSVQGMSGDKPGGGGVEVQDAESGKSPTNWAGIADAFTVGLADIGNAFGNPNAKVGGGLYEMAKQRMGAQQMAQLKQRQDMWGDAFDDARAGARSGRRGN